MLGNLDLLAPKGLIVSSGFTCGSILFFARTFLRLSAGECYIKGKILSLLQCECSDVEVPKSTTFQTCTLFTGKFF